MGMKTIPEYHQWTCDVCSITETEHKGIFKPKYWMKMCIYVDAHDFQGNAVAENNRELIICRDCAPLIQAAVEAVKERRKKELHVE